MSSYFNFTENGIEFKGFQDLRTQIKNDWNSTFGVSLDLDPTSPDGHHLDLECKTVNSVAEMVQGICANLNRSTASGQYLEFLAEYLGLHRQTIDGVAESDESLRNRMNQATTRGLATYNGMLSYLQDTISPLIGMSVNESGEMDDDGIPGHSIRVVVPESVEKTADEIAQAIWDCKPAGISTAGNKHGTAVDFVEKTHTVNYSIPASVGIEVKITITPYAEEALPSDYENQIATSVSTWASTNLVPGKDVITQRLLVPMFNVSGIETAVILVRKKGTSQWSSDSIAISSEETAVIAKADVQVDLA